MPKREKTEPNVFFSHTSLLALDKMHTNAYNVCMETPHYTVLRVRKETRNMLKLVAVLSHESMVETLDRLARQELARIQKGEPSRAPQQEDQA